MSRPYATGTTVSVEQSQLEIQRLLTRYGADSYASGWEGGVHVIQFRMHERYVRFRLVLPSATDFLYDGANRRRPRSGVEKAHQAEIRRRWRALLLIIKSKMELVSGGILDDDEPIEERFAREFLPNIVLPDGHTYGEYALPQIDQVYRTGKMPALLPGIRQEDLPALGGGR